MSLVVYRNSFDQFCLKDAETHGNCLVRQLENGGIALWDTKEHIYCKIHCIMTLEKSEIKFKGKILSERRAVIPSYQHSRFVMNVDCYGFDAKTYLSIDRTHFQVKQIQSVRMKIDYLLQCAVDFLLEKENLQTVLGADRSISNCENEDSYHDDSYYLLWQMANKAQKRIMLDNPEHYLDYISTEIAVLTWSEGGYLFSKCNVGEIIKGIERFCFLYQLHRPKIDKSCIQIVYEDNSEPVDLFLPEFNKFASAIDNKTIILDEHSLVDLSGATLSEIIFMDNLCFYSYSYNHDKACKMSTKTWKNLLKENLYSITVRAAIPAPQKYYNIAICEENLPLVNTPFLFEHAAYIVSPFAPNPNFEIPFHLYKRKICRWHYIRARV